MLQIFLFCVHFSNNAIMKLSNMSILLNILKYLNGTPYTLATSFEDCDSYSNNAIDVETLYHSNDYYLLILLVKKIYQIQLFMVQFSVATSVPRQGMKFASVVSFWQRALTCISFNSSILLWEIESQVSYEDISCSKMHLFVRTYEVDLLGCFFISRCQL